MINKYRSGRIHEGKIIKDLKSKGFENIRQSAGSRGPADIYCKKEGKKYYIQVKSNSAKMNPGEIDKLKNLAKQRGGVAVSIHRETGGKTKWGFFGNWS